MASRVAKSRGYNEAKREEIHDLTWQWVTSSTASDLNSNRSLLLAQLDFAEQLYMKESLVVTCFVALHPNLGAVTTQRNESMHPVIKAILNTQVTLETAFNNIRVELRRMHRLIREKEEESRIKRSRGVDFMAFQLLIGRVAIWAMERINPEWVEAVATAERIRGGEDIIEGPCRCEVVRFGFPCRHFHHLLRAAIESFPIPCTGTGGHSFGLGTTPQFLHIEFEAIQTSKCSFQQLFSLHINITHNPQFKLILKFF